MVIYWDLVLIINVIVDYAFLKTIAIIFKEEIKWYRALIAILLGSCSLLLFFIPIKYLYNIRYVIGILMGMVAYKCLNPMKRFLMIISFYIINLIFVGSLIIFEVQNTFFLLLMMFLVIILTVMEKILNKKIKNELYCVKIQNRKLKVLLDTGNNSYYLNKPIIFLDNRLLNNEYQIIGKIEIMTISGKQLIEVYQGPNIQINNQIKDVFYSFCKLDNYDAILHSTMGE